MNEQRRTTTAEARRVGDAIGVDWSRFDLEQFRAGMDVEFEHGAHDPQTDVTGDDPIITGKIALAHMKEFPDYYERLERMEREAEREWAEKLPAALASELDSKHRDTLRRIFSHPSSGNIEWRQVKSLLEAVGTATEEHNGKLKVTFGDETEVLQPPRGKDIDQQTIVDLRRMLTRAGLAPAD